VQQVLGQFCSATRPFSANDITAGSETELQASVEGQAEDVDLVLVLKESNYFLNIQKRAAAGESSERLVDDLQEFLHGHPSRTWENSWVRIPLRLLAADVRKMFERDCAADNENPRGGSRSDRKSFFVQHHGEACLRVPVSYLLKLSLQQAGTRKACPSCPVRKTASTLLAHFLNDNSSPETFSLYVTPLHRSAGMGRAIAAETAKRFFLSHLLILHANETFGLRASGQRALIYFAPHPPVRQKRLNTLISDSLYRELFMNPCLSGWRRGEEKLRYMHLCHQVLSRSQLNAVTKLRDAGIITRNLVVLPSTSNISLANNGTHLSLGSRILTGLLSDSGSTFTPTHEKFLGDLVIKIVEHFLPLFVGTYSAAPYRLDFCDFHPERALGFLPHELDGTHLRMLWRRWKKKAKLSVFGQPITPIGPVWLDQLTSALFGLRGDYVPDFRLIDYLVSLMSTDQSPALDGVLGNEQRLKRDLAQLGIFDESMSLYLLFKLRSQSVIGFSGFEGRHYSLFPGLLDDLGDAATLQALLTGLAFKYMATGVVRHADIPDDPTTESERRQFIFASALGLNTCNVRIDSPNHLLSRILSHAPKTRPSRRYADHLRVRVGEYRQALLNLIREDAADLVEAFGAEDLVTRLQQRLVEPETQSAAGRLTAGILSLSGARSPLELTAQEFNESAEQFYRETLRRRDVEESMALVLEDLRGIDDWHSGGTGLYRQLVAEVIGRRSASEFLASVREAILSETLDETRLRQCIHLALIAIQRDIDRVAPLVRKEVS
jgi:hypothetical protein